MAYTDLFNTAFNNLATQLATVTGLVVVNDPRNIKPPCVLIGAPTWSTPSMDNKFVRLEFPVQLFALGPGNLDALRSLFDLCAKVLSANVAVIDGRPVTVEVGNAVMPAYELTATMEARA